MNAVSVFATGISIVFITLGILAAFTYLIGKLMLITARFGGRGGGVGGGEGGGEVAAIVAKLHSEGKL